VVSNEDRCDKGDGDADEQRDEGLRDGFDVGVDDGWSVLGVNFVDRSDGVSNFGKEVARSGNAELSVEEDGLDLVSAAVSVTRPEEGTVV
jgi:hypothetical protein